jgi:hypothetical protein
MVANIVRMQSPLNFPVPYCAYKDIYRFFHVNGTMQQLRHVTMEQQFVIGTYFELRRQTDVNVGQSRQLAQGDMRAALLLLT